MVFGIKMNGSASLAVSLLFLGGVTSCTNNEFESVRPMHEVVLHASMDSSPASRTGFDADGSFFWSAADKLGVTTTGSPSNFTSLQLVSGGGESQSKFTGNIQGELDEYAVYPYSEKHQLNGTALNYYLPDTYTYTHVDADFFSVEKGEGNSFQSPLWGRVSQDHVTMKHLGGVFCIRLASLPVGQDLTLTLTSDAKLNGYFPVQLEAETPLLHGTQAESTEAGSVSIHFSNEQPGQSGVFYIPAAIGSYENLQLKVAGQNEEFINACLTDKILFRRSLKRIEINAEGKEERKELKNMTLFVHGVTKEKGWYDVNKKGDGTVNSDANMCWAAASACMLQWWQDQYVALGNTLPAGALNGEGKEYELAIFDAFKNEWDNTYGAEITFGIPWYLTGEDRARDQGFVELAKPNIGTGGYFASVWPDLKPIMGTDYVSEMFGWSTWQSEPDPLAAFSTCIKSVLSQGIASLTIRTGAYQLHAITLWGCDLDENGLVTKIYVTDSDDLLKKPSAPRVQLLNEYSVSCKGNEVGVPMYTPFTVITAIRPFKAFIRN